LYVFAALVFLFARLGWMDGTLWSSMW